MAKSSLCSLLKVEKLNFEQFTAIIFFTGGSSNGRTTDSGSVYLGSNPSPPAIYKHPALRLKNRAKRAKKEDFKRINFILPLHILLQCQK